MADDKLQEKLVEYIEDAHAMEQSVSRSLDSMISTTDDPEIADMLRHHKEETEEHERRLRERLDALDECCVVVGMGSSSTREGQNLHGPGPLSHGRSRTRAASVPGCASSAR
jgi:ferritin-like metal-binding protein YciE